MADIKAYRPKQSSLSQGQVLHRPYSYGEARLIVREMAEQLAMELAGKGQLASLFTLWVGYDAASLEGDLRYDGELYVNHYGRLVPAPTGGSVRAKLPTDDANELIGLMTDLFESTADELLLFRHINLCAGDLRPRDAAHPVTEQLDLFTDWEAAEARRQEEEAARQKNRALQQSILALRGKMGRNAVVRGMNLEEAGTAMERNGQVGGHKA